MASRVRRSSIERVPASPADLKFGRRLAREEVILKLTKLHAEAMKVGLFRTGHKLREAVQMVGYELADILEGKQADV